MTKAWSIPKICERQTTSNEAEEVTFWSREGNKDVTRKINFPSCFSQVWFSIVLIEQTVGGGYWGMIVFYPEADRDDTQTAEALSQPLPSFCFLHHRKIARQPVETDPHASPAAWASAMLCLARFFLYFPSSYACYYFSVWIINAVSIAFANWLLFSSCQEVSFCWQTDRWLFIFVFVFHFSCLYSRMLLNLRSHLFEFVFLKLCIFRHWLIK